MENQITSEKNQPELKSGSVAFLLLIDRIKKKWLMFFIVGLIFGLAGIFYASKQKPTYESRLTFALDEGEESGLSGALGLAAQFGINIGGSKSVFNNDNIVEIMLSRRVLESVLLSVDTFNNKPYTLIEYYLDHSSLRDNKSDKNPYKSVHFLPEQNRASFSYRQDSILYCMYNLFHNKFVSAQRKDKKLSIYELKVVSFDERFTKIFTDKLESQTSMFYTDVCSKKAKNTLDILEERVASMKNNISTSISNRAAIQDANINPAFVSAQAPLQKQQANIQVYGAAYAELFKNLEMARFQYLKGMPFMQIIDAADYPMQKNKVSKLKMGLFFSFLAMFILAFMLGVFTYKKMMA